jgi:hypothetical protein
MGVYVENKDCSVWYMYVLYVENKSMHNTYMHYIENKNFRETKSV